MKVEIREHEIVIIPENMPDIAYMLHELGLVADGDYCLARRESTPATETAPKGPPTLRILRTPLNKIVSLEGVPPAPPEDKKA